MAGVDANTETRSLFGSLVALVPDVAFAVARDVQRRTVSVVRATSRVPVAVITTVFEAAPMQAPLEVVETQLRPIAARGAEQRRQDVESARSMMTRMEPAINVFLERVVELLPIDALLARVDVDALISRVDVDALIKRVDVNDIVSRVDVPGLVTGVLEGIELGDLIQDSTTSVVSDARDAVRVQVIEGDGRLASLIDRILFRKR